MAYNYFPPINFNIPKLSFKSGQIVLNPHNTQVNDAFSTNPINEQFENITQIENDAKSNLRIKELLSEYNIPVKVNEKELQKLKKGHLKDTRVVAAQIYSSLPQDLKKQVNLSDIQTAAMFHDYGKILIPDSILNKKGNFSAKEREIMELHSELGYELLKNKGLNDNALNLIKFHHQNAKGTGYPAIDKNFDFNTEAEILNIADKYSALREKRSYKDALTNLEALQIIADDVNKGIISQDVYTALIKSRSYL